MEFPCRFGRSTHKSAEAALSATNASQAEDIPEYPHPDRSHAQSVDGTVGSPDTSTLHSRFTEETQTNLNILKTTKYTLQL